MSNQSQTVQVGPGLLSLLTVLFVGLKLTDYIDWPWVWVLAPLWIPMVIALVIVVVCFALAVWSKS